MQDAAIHVGFGSEIDDGVHTLCDDSTDTVRIPDIALYEFMTGIFFETRQVFEISGVSEFVEVYDPMVRITFQDKPDKIGSDKSRPACYQ